MGSIMLMAVSLIIGISAAAIIVSHASIVGKSVETAALDVSSSLNQLKREVTNELELLRRTRG